MKQVRWTGAQVANELKALVSLSNNRVQREIAKCSAPLSNRLTVIKSARYSGASSAGPGMRDVTSNCSVSGDSNI